MSSLVYKVSTCPTEGWISILARTRSRDHTLYPCKDVDPHFPWTYKAHCYVTSLPYQDEVTSTKDYKSRRSSRPRHFPENLGVTVGTLGSAILWSYALPSLVWLRFVRQSQLWWLVMLQWRQSMTRWCLVVFRQPDSPCMIQFMIRIRLSKHN